jgi:4-hydroxy-4-methyl-2-oxoglutarate aldolase
MAEPGDVLVLATGGIGDSAVAGDHFAAAAKKWGFAGIVTDGLVRDIRGIEATGIPVFAAGITPLSSPKHGNAEIGVNVTLGQTLVCPGDIIRADDDGVVVVPIAQLETFGTAFENVRHAEALRDAAAASGDKELPEWLERALAAPTVISLP